MKITRFENSLCEFMIKALVAGCFFFLSFMHTPAYGNTAELLSGESGAPFAKPNFIVAPNSHMYVMQTTTISTALFNTKKIKSEVMYVGTSTTGPDEIAKNLEISFGKVQVKGGDSVVTSTVSSRSAVSPTLFLGTDTDTPLSFSDRDVRIFIFIVILLVLLFVRSHTRFGKDWAPF